MNNVLSFETLRDAWKKLIDKRLDELQKRIPNLISLSEIYIKKVSEDEMSLSVQFHGFSNSVDDIQYIPTIKREIVQWIRKFSMNVQIMKGDPTTLGLTISKELKFTEASVSVMKRDSKTNKIKKVYRCIGGKKHGRKVSNPDDCIGVPDWDKKMNLAKTKRTKYGQSKNGKTKTRITNIISRKVRKANSRLKKARGF